MNKLRSGRHCVGEANLHLQLTPAYRQVVFSSRVLRDITTSLFYEQAQKLGVNLAAIDYGLDHVHLFVEDWRCWSVSNLAQRFKGAISHELRQKYAYLFEDKLWGSKFWSGGYFYRTVGAVTAETVKKYVAESQTKHWQNVSNEQKTLLVYH
jgi:putative transposase